VRDNTHMLALLKKYWPSILHGAGSLVIFLSPAVRDALLAHPNYSAPALAAWGFLLHWLTSPKNADTVAAAKVNA
jgi:hypothetical protein